MRDILTVFLFETKQKFKEKTFIISLLISCAIFFGITFIPKITNYMDSGKASNSKFEINEKSLPNDSKKDLAYFAKEGVDKSVIDTLSKRYNLIKVNNENELKEKVKNEEVAEGILLKDNISAKLYKSSNKISEISKSSIGTIRAYLIEDILKENYKYNIEYKKLDIDVNKIIEIDSVTPKIEIESFGRNPMSGTILSYFSVMFLYMIIMLHGSQIATNVAKEKETRTMEILITNVKSSALIHGKVFSGVFTSFVNLILTILSAVVGLMINLHDKPEVSNTIKTIISEIKTTDVLVLVLFTVVGVTMYFYIFAALGSLVSRLDELNQALSPVMILVMFATFIPMGLMTKPDSTILKVASFVPFSSPTSMLTRSLGSNVALYQIALSFIILIVTTAIMSIISIKIYRQGTLNYGNKMNLIKAFKSKIE